MNLHCVWTRFELIRRLGPSRLTSVLLKDRGWILKKIVKRVFMVLAKQWIFYRVGVWTRLISLSFGRAGIV
jgi:high-affinity nickel permease